MSQRVKAVVLLRSLAAPFLLLAGLLLAAGRLSYWQGWAYGGSNFLILIVNYLVLRGRPDLIQERLSPGKGTQWWDKMYFALSTPLFFAAIVLAALDAGRFHWGPAVPLWVYFPACAVYVLGQAIHLWAKATNRWFATPLLLGSWLALLPQLAAAPLLVLRTFLEDRLLQAELPGYAQYAQRVRRRLCPLW
jgi:protein-S-isoprenylcysteine O-methyltransferase Ste14